MSYRPAGFALEIFQKRYAFHEKETWEEACDRVAKHVATAEQGDEIQKQYSRFQNVLKDNLFCPGGRVWYGSGRPRGQLLNCFIVPTFDSREGWGKTSSDTIVIAGTGGGLGMNCSPIRPRYTAINGTGGTATGAPSFMEIINSIGEVIKGGGGRRTALMLALNLTHGDIIEFLDKKLDLKKLNNANVSVNFEDDPEDFFKKVKNKEDVELKFNGKVVGKVAAVTLWTKIVSNALKGGEPGILNGYFANKMSNVWYYKPLICTNPCAEIWGIEYDCCDLGALVLPRFLKKKDDKWNIDWKLLDEVIDISVRFLDNVLSVNNFPLPEIKQTCSDIRRIGLGIMGLSTMLLRMGLRYNSSEALEFVDKMMNFIKNKAYEASCRLAKEKGPFPKFDADLFLKSGFCKTLKPSMREMIKRDGMRNSTVLTNAPTGTTAIVCAVDSSIEPSFGPAWDRRFMDGDEIKIETVVHPLFSEMYRAGEDVSHFQSAYELSVRDHFEMQRVCQRHIDNACSKTINLPPGTTFEELSDLYMEFLPECKGITVYPEGGRENQPITPLSFKEAVAHIDHIAQTAISGDSCKNGVCEI